MEKETSEYTTITRVGILGPIRRINFQLTNHWNYCRRCREDGTRYCRLVSNTSGLIRCCPSLVIGLRYRVRANSRGMGRERELRDSSEVLYQGLS